MTSPLPSICNMFTQSSFALANTVPHSVRRSFSSVQRKFPSVVTLSATLDKMHRTLKCGNLPTHALIMTRSFRSLSFSYFPMWTRHVLGLLSLGWVNSLGDIAWPSLFKKKKKKTFSTVAKNANLHSFPSQNFQRLAYCKLFFNWYGRVNTIIQSLSQRYSSQNATVQTFLQNYSNRNRSKNVPNLTSFQPNFFSNNVKRRIFISD